MILIVCPNLAIDRILEVPDFRASEVQRCAAAIEQPGGKGSNAARVYRQLGGSVVLIGFVGRNNSSRITEPLKECGIQVETVESFDSSRICTILVDPTGKSHPTVINEESPVLDEHAAETLLGVADKWIPLVDAVFVTGSLSQGLANDYYRYVLERARSLGKFTALDATGPALAEGIHARPGFLKLNAQEFGELAGVAVPNTRHVIDYLRNSGSEPAHHTAVTFGSAGAILSVNGQFWQATPPEVFNTNPIGSGDSFAAGYLYEFMRSGDVEKAFRCALAAGAVDAGTVRPGTVVAEDVVALAKSVQIHQL